MLYYVVIRGYAPGIYNDPEEVLEQTRGIDNILVQVFPTIELARDFWREAIKTKSGGVVWPMDRPRPAPAVFSTRKFTLADLADSKLNIQGPGPKLPYRHVMAQYPSTWFKTPRDKRIGRMWVVATGRTPGMYNNWQDAHEQIHGLKGAVERYQVVVDYISARFLIKRLASLGLMDHATTVDLEDPEGSNSIHSVNLNSDELIRCTTCIDVCDEMHGTYTPYYMTAFDNIYDESDDGYYE